MSQIASWDSVSKSEWTYQLEEKNCEFVAYELTKLPDFSEPRFAYLCKEKDGRQNEVMKRQMQMLRKFHSLGREWAISLRLVKGADKSTGEIADKVAGKVSDKISMFLLFRYAGISPLTDGQRSSAEALIQNALMSNEYSFRKLNVQETEVTRSVSWAQEGAEIFKKEEEYRGDEYPEALHEEPRKFYVPYAWTAVDLDMEGICAALVKHDGEAAVEITIQPENYLEEERAWMNTSIDQMRESMNGETIRDGSGKLFWQGKKLPILRTPVDNLEKLAKQYDSGHVYIASIRLYARQNIESIARIYLSGSARNEGECLIFKNSSDLSYLKDCYRNANLSVRVLTKYWAKHYRDSSNPMRAQRLARLNSVEEISCFFRIPMPVKAGFPGFGYDTGLGYDTGSKFDTGLGLGAHKATTGNESNIHRDGVYKSSIKLGTYIDEAVTAGDNTVQFDARQLAKHGLIVGVPGSGKTTAMFNILYQFWDAKAESRIPFIILEPAKTEYRALKTLDIFQKDMLVFTLGDEGVSPFRFNPLEVLPGIKLESHISRLLACFVGAFDLFDPLPIFLEQAIRRTYAQKGWYEDSVGGEPGVETPTISDLCESAEYVVSHSGFDSKMRSDFNASLLERLNSLRRGSKGRMLDTQHTIPMEELMGRPIVMELDSLSGDEKSLMMMFLLSYVFEYCKAERKSGSPLKHVLVVEEAHNLIGAGGRSGENRANPRAHTIELFVNMLAEMRALGQGILIADQLPTAIAPQAVKQTNVKILMRMTARDDREEIGNTMDLNEEQMHQVVNFKTGHAYIYHEGEDRVRGIRMVNFKAEHDVEEPPTDAELKEMMAHYEDEHRELFMPFPECPKVCTGCDRRVRNQAELFVRQSLLEAGADPYAKKFKDSELIDQYKKTIGICGIMLLLTKEEQSRIRERYGRVGECFGGCVYLHMKNLCGENMQNCGKARSNTCSCETAFETYLNKYLEKNWE